MWGLLGVGRGSVTPATPGLASGPLMDEEGNEVLGNTLLLLFNSHWKEKQFQLPPSQVDKYWRMFAPEMMDKTWKLLVETTGQLSASCWMPQSQFKLGPRSMALFELQDKDENSLPE